MVKLPNAIVRVWLCVAWLLEADWASCDHIVVVKSRTLNMSDCSQTKDAGVEFSILCKPCFQSSAESRSDSGDKFLKVCPVLIDAGKQPKR